MILTVIGSLNKDLITRTSRIPSAGETLIASSYETGSGGKGANQAVACARLADRRGIRRRQHRQRQQEQQKALQQPQQEQQRQQHDEESPDEIRQDLTIHMVGAVGDDGFGQDLINGLASNGVDIDGIRVQKGQQTGVAIVLVDDESGENRILVSPSNANYSLTPADFDILPDPRPDLIILQLEIPFETVCHIIKLAKAEGVPVLLNPAPAPVGGLPREVYAGLTHLILNESEARILREGLQNEGEEDEEEAAEEKNKPEDLAKTAQRFLNLGVENIVITLGARGAYFASTQSQSQYSSQTTPANTTTSGLHPVPYERSLKAIDTTGAGDTFVGAYAVKICKGDCGGDGGGDGGGNSSRSSDSNNNQNATRINQAVQWANLAASRSVVKKGAQEAMPWREEIDELEG